MDPIELLITRRSIRKYIPGNIPQQSVDTIMEAAMYAPSANNEQPWHFIIIKNKDELLKIAEVLPHGKMLPYAALGIIVCADTHLEKSKGYWPVDCANATQNILLAAHAEDFGAVWLGVYPRDERMTAITDLFHLPENIKPFSVVALGIPDEKPEIPERVNPERVHYDKW